MQTSYKTKYNSYKRKYLPKNHKFFLQYKSKYSLGPFLQRKEERLFKIAFVGQSYRAKQKNRLLLNGMRWCLKERLKGKGTSEEGIKIGALNKWGWIRSVLNCVGLSTSIYSSSCSFIWRRNVYSAYNSMSCGIWDGTLGSLLPSRGQFPVSPQGQK